MPPASWLVLHEGKGAMYLCLYDWVWGNAVQVSAAAAGEPFLGCTDDDLTHFIVPARAMAGCVWELATLEHERAAWARHILLPDSPHLDSYLADRIPDGPVGRCLPSGMSCCGSASRGARWDVTLPPLYADHQAGAYGGRGACAWPTHSDVPLGGIRQCGTSHCADRWDWRWSRPS